MNDRCEPPAKAATEPKVNVLLVDDTPANLLALEVILDDLGQNLVKAGSGEEALGLLKDRDFAVVLLDVRMHGLDGFATARQIRSWEKSKHTPIIFLTAQDDNRVEVEEAYRLGAVDYLIKPLVPIILRAKVAGFIELYQKTEQVRRQGDQLRLLIHGTRDYAIFMLDPEGRIATWNAGAERIKGYKAEEIIGQHFSRFYSAEKIADGLPERELRVATAEGRYEEEGWRKRKDGSYFWANVVITALKDQAGTLLGFSKITRDLTERKQKEEALQQLHDDLERRVQERTAALAASNQALQTEIAERKQAEALLREASQRKDEFLAMLAHELRNPLAPIRNGLQIIRLPKADRASVEKAQTMMERQVQHMTRIVDDLLDVSRIHRGRVALRSERVDLARIVRVAMDDHRAAFENAGLKLDLVAPDIPLWIQGDPTRLTQILGNLLQNALKFTDRGGSVSVQVEADQRRALLTVRDTGIGIEREILPRIFETFAQADRSLERTKGGLGLGLSLVKALVELHGGEVKATSTGPGKGAEFVVRLPAEGEPAALSKQPTAPSLAQQRLRVLVVEDSQDAADSLRMLLELFGHEVEVAYTGTEGVKLAAEWRPDVILCDIGLPGMNGYEVANQLRQNPSTAKTRMIAITGYGAEEDRIRSQQAGFDQHLTKPVDPELLQAMFAIVP